jgi:O-antigen/teichoic acid export membrane protein
VRRRFALGALWAFIAAGTGQALPILVAAVLARFLDVEAYGRFMLLYGAASAFASVAGYSFGVIATRFVALLWKTDPERTGCLIRKAFKTSLTISGALTIVTIAASRWINISLLQMGDGEWSVTAAALLFLAVSFNAVQAGALAGFHCFSQAAESGVIRLAVGLPLAIMFASKGNVAGVLASLTIATVVACLVNHRQLVLIARQRRITLRSTSRVKTKSIWADFSLPVLLGYAVVMPVTWFGQLVLLHRADAYHEIALFNIALHWRSIIIFLPSALVQAAMPLMAEFAGEDDSKRSAAVFRLNLVITGAVAVSTAVVVSICSLFILSGYGAAYRSGWPVLVISSATAVLIAGNNVLGSAIVVAGKMWMACAFNGLWALALLSQAFPLGSAFGALGLTVAVATSYVLHTLWQSIYVYCRGMHAGSFQTSERLVATQDAP